MFKLPNGTQSIRDNAMSLRDRISHSTRSVACDIDGVLYPYMDKIRIEVEAATGLDLPQATTYNLQDCWGIDPRQWHEAHLRVFTDEKSHATDPIAGSAETLHDIAANGVHIDYVTRRADFTEQIGGDKEQAREITIRWIKQHFPTEGSTIYCVSNKLLYPHRHALMLEDNAREAQDLRNDGRRVLTVDQPYNQHDTGRRHIWGGPTVHHALHMKAPKAFSVNP